MLDHIKCTYSGLAKSLYEQQTTDARKNIVPFDTQHPTHSHDARVHPSMRSPRVRIRGRVEGDLTFENLFLVVFGSVAVYSLLV